MLLGIVTASAEEAERTEVSQVLYVVPFLNVMIPETVSSNLFDRFIDKLMAAGQQQQIDIRILKQDIDTVDREWLAQQYFITGELFDYEKESGCCSTELRSVARVYYFEPGSVEPVREIVVPGDVFFSHDRSELQREQVRLAEEMAQELSRQVASGIAQSP